MISSFAKWLARRKKKEQEAVTRTPSASKTTGPTPDPRLPTTNLDPDELEKDWKDSQTASPKTGITDSDREYWGRKNNPTTDWDPDELERAWKDSQRQD